MKASETRSRPIVAILAAISVALDSVCGTRMRRG